MFTIACSYASVERWVGKFLQATRPVAAAIAADLENAGKLL